MAKADNIFLIGPMGAGKSTIGRLLAAELHLPFCDTDKAIEDRCGADIPWIFDVEGEAGFRARESSMLAELSEDNGLVLATGGGIILLADNRKMLRSRGFVVYLRASVDQQTARTSKDKNRPLLQSGEPREVLEQLMSVRDPLYTEVADMMIDTDSRSPKDVAKDIAKKLREEQVRGIQ
ncbi:MAG: shikimate kinase AroK [Sinobacterium sp.]|jgi:shikimate kinase